jgi:orotate phosphoribosyltransferase
MMNRIELAAQIYRISHRTGKFRLRSGVQSHEYFDKYRFESDPSLLREVCAALIPSLPVGIQMLAGLELGGVPIATVLGQMSGLPVVFVRKRAKEYGTCQLAEGAPIASQKLLVVEDVVTSGGQIVQSTEDLRSLGAIVEHALCVIVRDIKAQQVLEAAGVHLTALFRSEDLQAAAESN